MSIPDPSKKEGYKPEYKPPWPTEEELARASEDDDAAEQNAYEKKRKPRKRKADDGTV